MVLHKTADGMVSCPHWDELCTDFLGEGRNRYGWTYVIFTDGTDFYAQNGTTGKIDYGGPDDNGAVDGADADAVIQAAVNAGGTGAMFRIRTGTYPLSAAIQYLSGQKFYGEGIDKTVLTVSTDISVFEPPDTDHRYYLGFYDMTFRLEDVSTTGPALDLSRVNRSHVARIAMWSDDAAHLWHTGILLDTVAAGGMAYYNLFEQLNIARFGTYGVYFLGSAGNRANVNWIHDSHIGSSCGATAWSIFFDYADHNTIMDCNVGGSPHTAIRLDHAAFNEVYHNFFEGTTNTCIHLTANAQFNMLRRNALNLVGPTLVTDNGTSTQYDNNRGYVTENVGTATFSGDGATTAFNIAHGCNITPVYVGLEAKSSGAVGDKYWSAGAANITVTFITAPPTGVDNIIIGWKGALHQ